MPIANQNCWTVFILHLLLGTLLFGVPFLVSILPIVYYWLPAKKIRPSSNLFFIYSSEFLAVPIIRGPPPSKLSKSAIVTRKFLDYRISRNSMRRFF